MSAHCGQISDIVPTLDLNGKKPNPYFLTIEPHPMG
jgi:hypothetical protein